MDLAPIMNFVNLLEDYYEAVYFVVLEVQTEYVRSVLEAQLVKEDAVDVLVPDSGGFRVSLWGMM
jgi:hypothetical protein